MMTMNRNSFRKESIGFLLILLCCTLKAWGDGRSLPFFRNYPANEYKAHNRNFDVVCDNYGTVFVANFEGLLYYDGASWRKIHTPGISRVTRLAIDKENRVWVGGYNVLGYLKPDAQGRLQLQTIISDTGSGGFGEVDILKVADKVYVHTINGKSYSIGKDYKVVPMSEGHKSLENRGHATSLKLPSGNTVTAEYNEGLTFGTPTLQWGKPAWAPLSEAEGLISNSINAIAFNGDRSIWGATDKGLFCVEAMSPYGMVNEHLGLKGEVNCITQVGNIVYFGTIEGLFCTNGTQTKRLGGTELSCWQFDNVDDDIVYAATADGLYKISGFTTTQLTSGNTLSVCMGADGNSCYTGEFDGIYFNTANGTRKRISQIEKATRLTLQGTGILAETIYGELWKISENGQEKCLRQKASQNDPKIEYTDYFGTEWRTDNSGRSLQAVSKTKYASLLSPWINPFKSKAINAFYVSHSGNIWVGGDFGAIHLDARQISTTGKKCEAPYIREVIAMNDSVIWGGYGADMKPLRDVKDISLPSSCSHILVTFSPKSTSLVKPTLYRYRMDGGRWSAWTDETNVEFNNPIFGKSTLEVQCMDIFGRISDTSMVEWYIQYPIYLRWWAILAYIIIFTIGIAQFFRWRTKRLEKQNEKLEGIVAERTSELSAAYDEQQKISAELSTTLDDLKRTQKDLVRMERTATAGKLTQGLIDRILNPINYINNFSKLTLGLAKDLKEDIEDEKDNMSEDNYEDCEDILDMMDTNLQKIEEHGVNTTRTLRAMEAMLNEHIGTPVSQDILPICRQAVEVTSEHFKEDVVLCGINIHAELPAEPIIVPIDADAINRALLSLLANSIYAVKKKYTQATYGNAEIVLTASSADGKATIVVRDNGIGIEDTIKSKVFDPFFTTKPTSEAAGVGLYLVREIINDHGGTISLNSAKGEYSEFVITMHN